MEENLNIIHIVLGKGNPNRMNGVNKVAFFLADNQKKTGYPVTMLGITPTPFEAVDYNYEYNLELFKDLKIPFIISPKLKERLKNIKKPAIVHLHGGFIPSFVTIAKILSKNKIPFIITSHGAYNVVAMKKNRAVKAWYFPVFEKKIIKRASAVHLIGKSEEDGLRLIDNSVWAVVIPNGQTVKTDYPEIVKTEKEKTVFGFLGRIDIHTKGLDIIAKAVKLLDNDIKKQIAVKIVGSGKEEKLFKELLVKEGVNEVFEFTGRRYGREKEMEIASFDIFLHPSRNEGMPGAVLEAAVQQVPVIVSEQTNVGDYIRKYSAGMVLAENNPGELSRAMKEMFVLHKKNKLEAMKNNALRMVKQEFTWPKIAGDLIKVYSELVFHEQG